MAFDPKKVWGSANLPTLPTVAVKLLELTRDPESCIRDYIEIIKTDPAISGKILKSANSTFFGLTSKVPSLDRAVPLLGTTVVTSLALSFSLAESAVSGGPLTKHYNHYWRQSVINSTAAEMLCSYVRSGLECEFFLAGLLMDIGRLAMMKTAPKDYVPILEKADTEQRSLHEVEREVLGMDHAEIGGELLKLWNLPESISAAIRLHNADLSHLQSLSNNPDFNIISVLAISASIGDYFAASNKGVALRRIRQLCEEFLKLPEAGVDELLQKIAVRMEAAAELFSIDLEEIGDLSDLMADASQQLAQLALKEHVASTKATELQKKVEREKQELESKHEQLQKQALHDPLTKVYNRQFFDETLNLESQRCCRYAAPLGVLFIDIDHFKRLNDTYGHQFGDEVLVKVAAAMKEVLRNSDTLARYGGEEFVILASEPTEKGIAKLAERLRTRIADEKLMFGEKAVQVTASIGAAITIPTRNATDIGKQLLASADEAMYESKQGGRNQFHVRTLLSEEERRTLGLISQRRFSRWLVLRQVLDIPTISKALLQYRPEHVRLGELAIRQRILTQSAIDSILNDQELTGQRFGEIALRKGLLTEEVFIDLLVLQQEEPIALAAVLGRLQLVEVSRLEQLLKEYLQEHPRLAPVRATVNA